MDPMRRKWVFKDPIEQLKGELNRYGGGTTRYKRINALYAIQYGRHSARIANCLLLDKRERGCEFIFRKVPVTSFSCFKS